MKEKMNDFTCITGVEPVFGNYAFRGSNYSGKRRTNCFYNMQTEYFQVLKIRFLTHIIMKKTTNENFSTGLNLEGMEKSHKITHRVDERSTRGSWKFQRRENRPSSLRRSPAKAPEPFFLFDLSPLMAAYYISAEAFNALDSGLKAAASQADVDVVKSSNFNSIKPVDVSISRS